MCSVRSLVLLVTSVVALAAPAPTQPAPLFEFHRNAWLNLHQFARALARTGDPPLALLSDQDRRLWAEGIESYRPYATRDLLFDDGMVAIKGALRGAEGRPSLEGVALDASLRATLERLMPIYRKHWWPDHDRAHGAWLAAVQPLLDRHGAAISQALARAYDTSWPSQPIPVDLAVAAGPYGAFTTGPPALVTMSPTTPSLQGHAALEMLFHEASHSPISDLFPRVSAAARERNVSVPPQLWHAVLFYTAGEVTKRELGAHGIAYTPYVDPKLYANLCGAGCGDKIATHWGPRLDGKVSVANALGALVDSFK